MTPHLRSLLIVVGGFLLLIGLLSAFGASRMETRILGATRLGYAQLALQEGSDADKERHRQRAWADRLFYFGVGATAVGVILQTAAGAWP